MGIDLAAADRFLTAHARVLDRRRFDVLVHGGDASAVITALDGYRNVDGGYGWGLEPDLRVAGSQPIEAMYAFETLEECGTAGGSRAVELCDWLAGVTFDDGGLPFVTPIDDTTACAPWFAGADATTSSVMGTCGVTAAALGLARHDRAVAEHPWLARATRYCLDAIARLETPHTYELLFALHVLDDLAADMPEAADHLARLAALLPPSGAVPVEGGIEGEMKRPLDFAPRPGSPVRAHLAPEAVEADLDRLAGEQQEDGGWPVDFASFSPAATLEWRGVATVRAVSVLRANGRL
ncbi:MAG: hypothetical protein KY443_03695 [Actinobacteria bacterium]|nr:hypothetical protein [Actinomycetota bacterium]